MVQEFFHWQKLSLAADACAIKSKLLTSPEYWWCQTPFLHLQVFQIAYPKMYIHNDPCLIYNIKNTISRPECGVVWSQNHWQVSLFGNPIIRLCWAGSNLFRGLSTTMIPWYPLTRPAFLEGWHWGGFTLRFPWCHRCYLVYIVYHNAKFTYIYIFIHIYILMQKHHMSTSITGVLISFFSWGHCFWYTCCWSKNFINCAVQEDVLERIAAVTDGYKAPWFFTVQTRWCMHQYMLTREGSCVNECASQGY